MIWQSLAVAVVLMGAVAVQADPVPAAVNAVLEDARADCESFEAGDFSLQDAAVEQRDLTGDGQMDWIIDSSLMGCSSAASMYCGTGGCELTLVVGAHITERLAHGWALASFNDRPVLLLDVHGSLCGGINPTPCIEALIWDDEPQQFSTLAPRPE